MPSTKAIKQRIKSVRNTAQITKAMEVVSATKMRKSQEVAIRARPYAVASLEILQNLLSRSAVLSPLLEKKEIKNSALMVVTSDKGLAGAFNGNVLKKAEQWIQEKKSQNKKFVIVAVGKKSKEYFERRGEPIFLAFWGFGDFTALSQTLPVADTVINGFLGRDFEEVEAIYTHFRTTLAQETAQKRILPVTEKGIEEIVNSILPERGKYAELKRRNGEKFADYRYEYKFEPDPAQILSVLIPQLLRMHIHHIILESNASEHSARMVAMKNASDNAKELMTDLARAFNKARQAVITRELTEITAGKEALEA